MSFKIIIGIRRWKNRTKEKSKRYEYKTMVWLLFCYFNSNCAIKVHCDNDEKFQDLLHDLNNTNLDNATINEIANQGSSKLKLTEIIKDFRNEMYI